MKNQVIIYTITSKLNKTYKNRDETEMYLNNAFTVSCLVSSFCQERYIKVQNISEMQLTISLLCNRRSIQVAAPNQSVKTNKNTIKAYHVQRTKVNSSKHYGTFESIST